METKKKIEAVAMSLSLIIVAGLFVNIGNVLIILNHANKTSFNILLGIFSLLGFVVLPLGLTKCLGYELRSIKLNTLSTLILSILILSISHFILKSDEIMHDFIIATGEELLFRYIIFSILLSCFNKKYSILIGSLFFALLLHLNGDFFVNLLIKFPSSIILYFLFDRYGIQYSVGVHWFYNIIVGSVL